MDVGSRPEADVFERSGSMPPTSADRAESHFRWTSIAACAAKEMAVQPVYNVKRQGVALVYGFRKVFLKRVN